MTQVTGEWRENPATQKVCRVLESGGAQALFVGGCVRNALLDEPVRDIDIATDALPETVLNLARDAGLRAIPTGIEHGTVTILSDGIPHEVTTFRRDVDTDGRRATVAFSQNVKEDAARRDFTMNALYARSDGTLIDPLGGIDDLKARRVLFIGSAEARIREDYLRSLRYFRFHAWYGDQSKGLDADAMAAISANLDGLEKVSRERIGSELLKLLGAADPAPAIAGMRQANVMARVLPGCDDRFLAPVIHLEHDLGVMVDPIRRLAALGGDGLKDALRLSRAQATRLAAIRNGMESGAGYAELGYRLGTETARDVLILRHAMMGQPPNPDDLIEIEQGSKAGFPISASDLMPEFQGKALGEKLAQLETEWIRSGFTLDRQTLLGKI